MNICIDYIWKSIHPTHATPATLHQDRKPLTSEPIHDANAADLALEILEEEEKQHDMEDILEAW